MRFRVCLLSPPKMTIASGTRARGERLENAIPGTDRRVERVEYKPADAALKRRFLDAKPHFNVWRPNRIGCNFHLPRLASDRRPRPFHFERNLALCKRENRGSEKV